MVKVKKGSAIRVKKRKRQTPKKKYKCAECDYWATAPSYLRVHMVTHSRERNFPCNVGACKKKFSTNHGMLRHKRVIHLGIKPTKPPKNYQCGICDKWVVSPSKLASHVVTHSELKPFACDVGECKRRFAHKSTLRAHRKTHLEVRDRPYACEKCEYKGFTKHNLDVHMQTHTQALLSCELCDFMCNHPYDIFRHGKIHADAKHHACNFGGWCGYRSAKPSLLKQHQKTHTIEGQIRKKKQENRVNTILKEWGYDVDPELTIKAKTSNCLTDTDRYYARIDFTVINCTSAILILECDENAHAWYNLKCEFSRMADVQASLALAGYTAPVYWIRYNPNGKYHVNGQQVQMHRPKREAALKKHLKTLCSPDFQPQHQVNLHYLFYDLESSEAGPSIISDPDFPAVLKPMVSWCP